MTVTTGGDLFASASRTVTAGATRGGSGGGGGAFHGGSVAPPAGEDDGLFSFLLSLRRGRNLHHEEDDDPMEQTEVRKYKLWTPQEIAETVQRWADHYPNLLTVTTSQEAYGLPAAGSEDDCPYEQDIIGCPNYILTLQDYLAHPEQSDSSKKLPEVLWSGEVHGNERVGPTAVLEATELLLKSATCEALPRIALKPTGDSKKKKNTEDWIQEMDKAHSCRTELYHMGIDDEHRQWLARLVTTRRLVIVPTANALGYYQSVREENHMDPNRDFPYDRKDPTMCMRTIAGRTLNEIFRQHQFQLSLTFHGGMEVVGYEWGAPSWKGDTSPDDVAQDQIATAYSKFAGGWNTTIPYNHGPMNDLVYPVNGGMEDWAYAGSWDPDRVIQCQPETYDGYSAEKTKYDSGTLRVFNMLIETSNSKIPKHNLGSSLDLMTSTPVGNGHVSRNIRLALLASELVQPYLVFRNVNELELSEDLVPSTEDPACTQVAVPHNSRKIVVRWQVGGTLTIDETQLYYVKIDNHDDVNCDNTWQPDEDLVTKLQLAESTGETSGNTQFSQRLASQPFSASIDISGLQAGDTIAVLGRAKVDQEWGKKLEDVQPDLPPQSHIANARTNPDWHYETDDGKVVQGRADWYSRPLMITLVDYGKNPDGSHARVETEELTTRYDPSILPSDSKKLPEPPTAFDGKEGAAGSFSLVAVLLGVGVVIVLSVGLGRVYLQYQVRQSQRERVRDFIEDETAISPGLKGVAGGREPKSSRRTNGYRDIRNGSDDDDDDNGALELGTYSDANNNGISDDDEL